MLNKIYKIFSDSSVGVRFACASGCATCCTRSVTLTTGEGRLILDYLNQTARNMPALPKDLIPLRPPLTINGLAECYLAKQEGPEESESPWLFEPCFFLRENRCDIYPARPFACRSLVSTINCGKSGMAEAPEGLITLSIVTNQILEDLDRGGWWGNMADVLAFLDAEAEETSRSTARERLLPNRPMPGLLVSPDESELVEKYLAYLATATGFNFCGKLTR